MAVSNGVSLAMTPTSFAEARAATFARLMSQDVIILKDLQAAAALGVPDDVRPSVWKMLLRYVPLFKPDRERCLARQRQTYRDFMADWLSPSSAAPSTETQSESVIPPPAHTVVSVPPSPLPPEMHLSDFISLPDSDTATAAPVPSSVTSTWAKASEDETREAIDKDVHRTYPMLHFFRGDNLEALFRILFIFAKTHRGIGYVQGMNELVAPLFYVFGTEKGVDIKDAEADTFFCFANLMGEVRDAFIRRMDDASEGIHGIMARFSRRLRQVEPEVWNYLDSLQIVPEYYSFRWLTTLLAREFELPDTIRLWDALFSDAKRFSFIFQRSRILSLEFAEAMQFLQNYPSVDVLDLLQLAERIRDTYPQLPEPISSEDSTPRSAPTSPQAVDGEGGGIRSVKSWLSRSAEKVKLSAPGSAVRSGLSSVGATLRGWTSK